jgi:hypothetical protein
MSFMDREVAFEDRENAHSSKWNSLQIRLLHALRTFLSDFSLLSLG